MQKKAKHSVKLKRLFLGAITGLVLTSTLSADKKAAEPAAIQNDNLIKAFKEGRAKNYSEYIEMTDYFTSDTLYIDKHNARNRICLGQYLPDKNKVEIKYFITDYTGANHADSTWIKRFDNFNMEQYVNGVKAHELTHQAFHAQDIKSTPFHKKINDLTPKIPEQNPYGNKSIINVGALSLTDLAALGQYNEIGAELGRCVYERERYLKTGNINEFHVTDAYVKAIQDGTINPADSSTSARQSEYNAMMNAVFNRWMKTEKHNYAYTSLIEVKNYIKKAEKNNIILPEVSDSAEMSRRIKVCLTLPIDGKLIDFSPAIANREITPQPMVQKAIDDYNASHNLYKTPKQSALKTFTLQMMQNNKSR
jgi:hypothetical protein